MACRHAMWVTHGIELSHVSSAWSKWKSIGIEWKSVRWEGKIEWKKKCDQFDRGRPERKGKEGEKRKGKKRSERKKRNEREK